MKVVELQKSFGIDNLVLTEREKPEPKRGEVLLKMKAFSLNYRDILMVEGLYNPRQPLPLIPASDGVGEVIAVGEGVSRVKVGDRVAPNFGPKWISGEPDREKLRATLGGPLDGVLAEYMVIDERSLVHIPEHLSDIEGATLPCAGLTAWSALVTHNSVKPGETILVQGTGGVSLFALMFGKMLGAKVIVISSSDEKLERARALGADETLNYKKTPEWGKAVRKLTGGQGVDHIVEVGGAETLKQSLKAIGFGGHIALIGVLTGVRSQLDLTSVFMNHVRMQGILVGHREGFEAMNEAISLHKLRPTIDKVFPFEETPAAFSYMKNEDHFGKIVIQR